VAKGPVENPPEPAAPIPGPSVERLPPVADFPVPSIDPTSSEDEVEQGLRDQFKGFNDEPSEKPTRSMWDDDIWGNRVCREGGVQLLSFLIAKAISPIATTTIDPKTWVYKDIAHLPELEQKEWRDSCFWELEALKKCDVFELVPRLTNRKVIKNRWVFDVKSDGRKRARLVAKGFSQVEGLDYDQIFSPVVRFETVRLILAMAALYNWTVSGLDVQNAFLYGKLEEEIYMEQPEGFHVPGFECNVLRLKHALYGLKQAGLAWW